MPRLRGVDVSIAVQPDSRELPEFPHPDASSIHILQVPPAPPSPNAHQGAQAHCSPSSPLSSSSPSPPSPASSVRTSGSPASRIRKANPTVSVYIPSIPGAQFCLRYSVTRCPEPPGHLFFKAFMNGRHITSWGIDPAVQASGSIARALYEPCDKWHYKEHGVVLKRQGFESRSFRFALPPSLLPVPVAEDGGLIEILVFRARGRRQRAPLLGSFREQDKYGISSPSTGLVEYPEEMSYYDWILTDPKDAPFASFRFHYRSRDNISLLNPGFDHSIFPGQVEGTPSSVHDSSTRQGQKHTESTNRGKAWWVDGNVFNDAAATAEHHVDEDGIDSTAHGAGTSSTSSEPLLEAVIHSLPPATAALSDPILHSSQDSPVPDVRHASRKSIDSPAPSIDASLLRYNEEDSVGTETIEYGTATKYAVSCALASGLGGKRQLPQPPRRTSTSSSLCDTPPSFSPSSPPSCRQQNGGRQEASAGDGTSIPSCDQDARLVAFRRLGASEGA